MTDVDEVPTDPMIALQASQARLVEACKKMMQTDPIPDIPVTVWRCSRGDWLGESFPDGSGGIWCVYPVDLPEFASDRPAQLLELCEELDDMLTTAQPDNFRRRATWRLTEGIARYAAGGVEFNRVQRWAVDTPASGIAHRCPQCRRDYRVTTPQLWNATIRSKKKLMFQPG